MLFNTYHLLFVPSSCSWQLGFLTGLHKVLERGRLLLGSPWLLLSDCYKMYLNFSYESVIPYKVLIPCFFGLEALALKCSTPHSRD